mmetsp:Transcript_1416/g.3314  ORF Transcript_1416/g.3314 Transcript_1416/m.3314 type:complete len:258 (+) Transcript_1416:510-1283(+)
MDVSAFANAALSIAAPRSIPNPPIAPSKSPPTASLTASATESPPPSPAISPSRVFRFGRIFSTCGAAAFLVIPSYRGLPTSSTFPRSGSCCSFASSSHCLILLLEMKRVCSFTQGWRPSSVAIWLYEIQSSSRVAPTSSRPCIFLIWFRPSDNRTRFFRPGSEIILSMAFVDRERRLQFTSAFKLESILLIGGIRHSSATASASSGFAPSFFSLQSWSAFAQEVILVSRCSHNLLRQETETNHLSQKSTGRGVWRTR